MAEVSQQQASDLNGFDFSDLFVTATPESCTFKATPDALNAQTIPDEWHGEIKNLHKSLLAESNGVDGRRPRVDFRAVWRGVRFRVGRMDTPTGAVFVCRRYRVTPRGLCDLGFPQMIYRSLMSSDKTQQIKHGLVLFTGETGSGKTTSAVSYVIERLHKFGGVAWTAENPIELIFQGRHGPGVCYQTEVVEDDFSSAITRMWRASPNIMFIGEIRDGAAAKAAVQAALSGVLVISTYHASSLEKGLGRLARAIGDSDSDGLADALRAAFHLRLESPSEGNGHQNRVLKVDPLFVTGISESGIRSKLRKGAFEQLSSDIDQQKNRFMSGISSAGFMGPE